MVPVYGLDDAPAAWRTTVTSFLVEGGYVRNLIEPCWLSKFDEKTNRPISQILIKVDDFIAASHPQHYEATRKLLTERFDFGKWDDDEAEYAGRHIKCLKGRIWINQKKYIVEHIHPVVLAKGRKSKKDSPFEAFRALIYKLNWLGRETRPEVSDTASILASRLPSATISHGLILNKVVNYLQSTSDRNITMWAFDPSDMAFSMRSDAGGINGKFEQVDDVGLPADATQGARMVLAASRLPVGHQAVPASPLAWRNGKLKRKVFSTFGGETQAMLQGIGEVDWLQMPSFMTFNFEIGETASNHI